MLSHSSGFSSQSGNHEQTEKVRDYFQNTVKNQTIFILQKWKKYRKVRQIVSQKVKIMEMESQHSWIFFRWLIHSIPCKPT